ncbi:hypothetical protein [Segniliparus rugosus]|uniref:Uncharacterized protein n=1 Tax=Segniliparus rugosus (strain ATCC BAA-974 / DSM 45345 / CCUG 50838 / CIP 108380 / JCM 13579 / CDC 945) TaxID=679197 RepID=E5XT39_SEGRC|nr:hypothetical protein [Segniliparus rugosus]EFV12450.1 hypothetical protein HMPREF9336_02661 [Segniliparus rugosus ATCC BAA-974]
MAHESWPAGGVDLAAYAAEHWPGVEFEVKGWEDGEGWYELGTLFSIVGADAEERPNLFCDPETLLPHVQGLIQVREDHLDGVDDLDVPGHNQYDDFPGHKSPPWSWALLKRHWIVGPWACSVALRVLGQIYREDMGSSPELELEHRCMRLAGEWSLFYQETKLYLNWKRATARIKDRKVHWWNILPDPGAEAALDEECYQRVAKRLMEVDQQLVEWSGQRVGFHSRSWNKFSGLVRHEGKTTLEF